MRVFGFACHAPDQVVMDLRRREIPRTEIYIVGEDELLKRKSKRKHFVFMTVLSFRRNREVLEIMPDIICYVCDNPLALSDFNFCPADYEREEFFHIDGFSLTDINMRLHKCPDVAIARTPFNVIEEAKIEAKDQITFFNQFMTFVYSKPSETHQKPLKEIVCKWMLTKDPFMVCFNKIKSTVALSEKDLARVTVILTSETADLYRKALQLNGPEEEIAKIYKISAYEMRYIREVSKKAAK